MLYLYPLLSTGSQAGMKSSQHDWKTVDIKPQHTNETSAIAINWHFKSNYRQAD